MKSGMFIVLKGGLVLAAALCLFEIVVAERSSPDRQVKHSESDERPNPHFPRTGFLPREKSSQDLPESFKETVVDKMLFNACRGVVGKVTSAVTKQGQRALCVKPTEKELMAQLKAIGGYNRLYVAPSKSETKHFVQIIHGYKPVWPDNGKGGKEIHVRVGKLCVRKNDPTNFKMKSLCTQCQQTTVLPSDRFPRYLNELVCGESSERHVRPEFCGWRKFSGMCVQRKIYHQILRRTNNFVKLVYSPYSSYSVVYKQVWEPYTQEIRSCCECQGFQ